jgi:ribonuclease J
MIQNVTLAREMGILDLPADRVIDAEDVSRHAPGDVCVLCTGSQGEPMSALALMATGEHKVMKISAEDVVVLSAHAIPGNEPNVHRVIDGLHRAGAVVLHDATAPVHVSGHANREELKFMLGLVSPDWFIPVHGEYRHLVHHAALATEMGLPPERVVVCEDGDAVTLDSGGLEVERRAVPAGYQYVDGIAEDVTHGVLRDRRNLGEEGFVVVIVTVDASTGELVSGPEIVTRGWVFEAESDELLDDAKATVRDALAQEGDDGTVEVEILRRNARRALGRLINERTRRRPAIIPVVIEV